MQRQYNLRNPAVKRLMREAQELSEPTEQYHAQPLEDNLFEWHFTIRGPEDSEFEGGLYHGRIILPPEYPMKPPSIILLTPNGRFETNKKICLSISGYHPESWQPSWSIRTALLAIIGFMPTHGAGAIGSLDYSSTERKALAKKSQSWKCSSCGDISSVLPQVTSSSEETKQKAKELASQISFQAEKEKKPSPSVETSERCNTVPSMSAPVCTGENKSEVLQPSQTTTGGVSSCQQDPAQTRPAPMDSLSTTYRFPVTPTPLPFVGRPWSRPHKDSREYFATSEGSKFGPTFPLPFVAPSYPMFPPPFLLGNQQQISQSTGFATTPHSQASDDSDPSMAHTAEGTSSGNSAVNRGRQEGSPSIASPEQSKNTSHTIPATSLPAPVRQRLPQRPVVVDSPNSTRQAPERQGSGSLALMALLLVAIGLLLLRRLIMVTL